jgi:hypothetical protein
MGSEMTPDHLDTLVVPDNYGYCIIEGRYCRFYTVDNRYLDIKYKANYRPIENGWEVK